MTTERYDRTLTAEDDAIVQRLSHVAFMTWLAEARDSTDYRAMLARERYESTRIGGSCRSYLPMSAVLTEERHGLTLREAYEQGRIR